MSAVILVLLGLAHSVLPSPGEECRATGERHFLSDHEQCDRWGPGLVLCCIGQLESVSVSFILDGPSFGCLTCDSSVVKSAAPASPSSVPSCVQFCKGSTCATSPAACLPSSCARTASCSTPSPRSAGSPPPAPSVPNLSSCSRRNRSDVELGSLLGH